MISSLTGAVAAATLDTVVLEVGGVGLLVHTTPATAASARPGESMRLATSLVVREDSLTLFGFGGDDERALFEQVQTVSGVGPRLALAMLAVHDPAQLSSAIATGNVTALTKVPGIGKKTAERIVVELRDRAADLGAGPVSGTAAAGFDPLSEAVIALQQLGYKPAEADRMARAAAVQGDSAEAIIRKALQQALR